MKIAIISGASKGLGAAIAKRMLNEGIGVITTSRSTNSELESLANEKGLFFRHYPCDLSNQKNYLDTYIEITDSVLELNSETIYLVNNAGVIEPIDTVGKLREEAINMSIEVNLIAPMLITNLILGKLQSSSSKLFVVNVSSGAAERPKHGWSAYCSAKAGLNMFTKNVALEQESVGTPHKIIAFSPGIMDTDMQGTIRSSSKESFHELERFQQFKENGSLRSPEIVGNAMLDLLLQKEIENGKVYNVNELI
ncbi:(S)-benzoin forming benzil reductase [Peribacillus alkalitolerans]|uniref:(S)-benzoin forming benzil reductase n=1 Tax=Peribacillus alkalitolerans TaxID=1550385 RepID=UPI0013D75335|nr:(S)-benzoin forming benzil reductase [Peribacillus alkalitolerans]